MNDRISSPSAVQPTVAVYGATGHTGRFVIAELSRRGLGVVAIGRNAAGMAAADLPAAVRREVAAIDDPASLARALTGAAAVINCAGPFLDTAELLVAAALHAAIPYFDVTAEQASAQAIFERYDSAAEEAGVVVIPAMSFYGGLSDLLTTAAMGDWTDADEVRLGIALDSWRPTGGTRLTGQRNTAPRVTITDGELARLPDPAPSAVWSFAEPFGAQEMVEMPFTEAILIRRHLQVSELHTYLNLTPLRDLRNAATAPPVAADPSGRSSQTFRVEVEVRRASTVRRASAQGQDIYAVTAPMVVEAVVRVLGGATARGGVFAPGALFDAESFLAALAPDILAGTQGA
ncbi:saccharopine dehydrogenase NADP-binding domain-containing protein [Phenylobacterium sp.]|uniref:saccharopine dehydrogenase family protein n=1 Tax=Phenylobacterium sp. TaxID=1871053 RepID=UPI00286ADFE6|nr:saccharopine dehydrogenase NADP-binding domain-containing protein [Phenylobacterium sp.]